jgi:sec-independent protein translocase protein TatB|tara:strand:- start:2368 stop:2616 length:249 start_codon:yes stop_codon:yes gene_type:complete
MPQIGWFELLIIVVVALLIIGPKDLPIVLKKIGSWTGTIKKYFSDVQSNIRQITNIEDNNVEKKNKKKIINKDKKIDKDENK